MGPTMATYFYLEARNHKYILFNRNRTYYFFHSCQNTEYPNVFGWFNSTLVCHLLRKGNLIESIFYMVAMKYEDTRLSSNRLCLFLHY
jgi:hypothetical protein